MQALAWLGFALGMALLLLTGSSVIKTLLIPRNLSSAIGTAHRVPATPGDPAGSPQDTDTPLRMPG